MSFIPLRVLKILAFLLLHSLTKSQKNVDSQKKKKMNIENIIALYERIKVVLKN